MDFKSLLQTMDNISETVHKAGPGGYGNRHGSEAVTDQYGKKVGKVSLASLGPKDDTPKTRGRPVDPDKPKTGKDDPKNTKVGDIFGRTTGDVPKGKKGTKVSKMADADKTEKKAEKKSLKDWIEASEANQLNEADQVTIAPAQQNTQVIKQGDETLGTVTNPQLAAQIKQSLGKGEMTLAGDNLGEAELDEKFDKPVTTDPSEKGKYKGKSKSELLKAYNHLKKTGPHKKGSKQYENMKELAFAIRAKSDWGKVKESGMGVDREFQNQERNAGLEDEKNNYAVHVDGREWKVFADKRQAENIARSLTNKGKKAAVYVTGASVSEAKDLPGKQDNLDVAEPKGKLTKADFEALRKKKKVSEARVMEESEYTYEKVGKILAQENPTMNSDSDEFANAVYHELIQMGMTPKSANYKLNYDPDFLGDVATSYGHYVRHDTVDEGEFTQHYMDANKPSKVRQDAEIAKAPQQHTPWSVDPINAATDRAGSFLKNLATPKKTFEGKNMKDIQLENWEKELNSLLNEGITVSSSTGQQGSPDSVSVNATDGDAQQLLQVLRSAGVGVFGGEQEHSDYGAPMGGHEPTGAGSEPEMSPAVVGDGDDMMALIKKMSGIQDSGAPEGTASSDYESEEGSDDDHQAQHGSDGHSHEEDDKEETDEGNMFTGNLAKAREQGKKQADLDGDGDMEQVKEQGHDHEDHGTCNECGMYEARCVCEPGEEAVDEGVDLRKPGMSDEQYASMGQKTPTQAPYKNPAIQAKHDELRKTASGQQVANEPVAEDYANEAGHEEMAQLKHLLSMGNDMHKEKRSQAVGDPKQVTFETTLLKDSTSLLQDFKKLSGIK